MTANTRSYTLANKHPNIEMGSVFKKICHQQKWKPSWIQFETFEDVCFAWIFTSPLIFTVPTPSLALWRELCSSLKCLVLKHWRSLMFNEKKSDGTEAILYIIYIYMDIYIWCNPSQVYRYFNGLTELDCKMLLRSLYYVAELGGKWFECIMLQGFHVRSSEAARIGLDTWNIPLNWHVTINKCPF